MKVGLQEFVDHMARGRYRYRQAAGWVVTAGLVIAAQPVWWGFLSGAALMAVGAAVRTWAAGLVRKDQRLATDGPYRFVRHPQYAGNCLLAVGLSLAVGLPAAILLWAAVIWLFYVPAIRREDKKLSRVFGDEWTAWAATTPALIPARLPASVQQDERSSWSVRQWVANGEPIWLALLALGMALVWWRLP